MAEWSIPLRELADKTGKRIEKVVRESALIIFSRVILRSPVDTGRFRANWNFSYDSVDTSTSDAVDPSGGGVTARMKSAVLGFNVPSGGVIFMANSLPYAAVLEYGLYPNPPKRGTKSSGGFSKQAPQGMIRVTVREFEQAVREAIAKP